MQVHSSHYQKPQSSAKTQRVHSQGPSRYKNSHISSGLKIGYTGSSTKPLSNLHTASTLKLKNKHRSKSQNNPTFKDTNKFYTYNNNNIVNIFLQQTAGAHNLAGGLTGFNSRSHQNHHTHHHTNFTHHQSSSLGSFGVGKKLTTSLSKKSNILSVNSAHTGKYKNLFP